MDRFPAKANKPKRGRLLNIDENKNYDKRVISGSLNENLKKKTRKRNRCACRRRKAKRTVPKVPGNDLTDDWSATFHENLPYVEAILKDCGNELLPELDGDLFPEVSVNTFLTTDEKQETVSGFSETDVDAAVCNLVLDLEEDLILDDDPVDEPDAVELTEDWDIPEEAFKAAMKFGSTDPMISGHSYESPFQSVVIATDSDDSDTEPGGSEGRLHLKACDVLMYVKALKDHMQLNDYPTVKMLLNSLANAFIPMDFLTELMSELFETVLESMNSSDKDVARLAKVVRDSLMSSLASLNTDAARVPHLQFWLTKT